MNKKMLFAFAAASVACSMATAASRKIFLGGEQITKATHAIVKPVSALPSETYAAEELRDTLAKMTGETLGIVADNAIGGLAPIYVGKCANLPVAVDWNKLGAEGTHIETKGKALVLAGGKRGAIYAVYSFLEDYLDCRWFAFDCEVIPDEGVAKLGSIKNVFVPPLEYREIDYPCRIPVDFGVKRRFNGSYMRSADPKYGGRISYRGFVHTFNQLVPPNVYGDTHPEYFSEIEGVRMTNMSQLCLTNPDVLKIATEQVRKWMRETPEATIFSVSQNDWGNYCTCAKCKALAEKEGSESGPMIHFVNAIARAVHDEFPDKIVDTLAYHYSRKPPKYVKPEPNVAVRLCSIECCFSHPLDTCEENKTFVDDINGWNAICNRLHIWDYVINYRHCIMPFPNLRVLRSNVQFLIKHGVTGIYEEANYFSKGGELSELRTYMLSKFLWDPNYDENKAIYEFTEAYYGPAGKQIREYINLIHDTVCDKNGKHVRIYSNPTDYLNDEAMLAKAVELFDKAEEVVAKDEKLLHRVQVARLPLMYAQVGIAKGALHLDRNALISTSKVDDMMVEKFREIANKEGIKYLSEGKMTVETWANSNAVRPLVIRNIRNQFFSLDIFPALGGRIWRATDLRAKREVVLIAGDNEVGYHPAEHGFEGYANGAYKGPGASETFRVRDSGPTFVQLECVLPDGIRLQRRIELLPDRPAFRVTQKLLSDKPVAKKVTRIHPAFAVTDTNKAKVYTKLDSGWKEWSLERPNGGKGEYEVWFNVKDKKINGQWAILDEAKPYALLNTFTADTDYCYLNWNGKDNRVNLEMWSKTMEANAENGPTISSTYEVIPLDKLPWK